MTDPSRRTMLTATAAGLMLLAGAPPCAAEPAPALDVGYVPTPPRVVIAMLRLAKVTEGDLLYDLGCGDGRIPIEAAKRHRARAIGIDLDPERIAQARAAATRERVSDRARFIVGDLFEQDLSPATVVTLYLLPRLNLRLRPKLLALAPGTRIVSHGFDMGDWAPERTETVEHRPIHLWTVPPRAG